MNIARADAAILRMQQYWLGRMLLFSHPAVLALSASFFFGLALILTQFGLRHVRPSEGSLVSIPFLALILWALAVFFLDFSQWNNRAAGTFLVIGVV